MKEKKEKITLKGLKNPLIMTCPVCGFTFKPYDPKTRKKVTVCPMCGHKFIEPDIFPNKSRDLGEKYF
jgi:rubrerythrin